MKKYRPLFVLFYFVVMWLSSLSAESRIIVVYGSSCSGKSSLSSALVRELGTGWRVIDRDVVIEQYQDEERADCFLLKEVQAALEEGVNVIIDTQVPPKLTQNMQQYEPCYVFVYANLPTLILRDAHRCAMRNRSEIRQHYARSWVYESFALLLTTTPGNSPLVDAIDPKDIPEDILDFSLSEYSQDIFSLLLFAPQSHFVYANYPCDILVNSHLTTLDKSVNDVVKIVIRSTTHP